MQHNRGAVVPRLLSLAAGALLLFATTACDSRQEQADTLAQQASALAEAGDRLGAVEAINKAIALRDDNADYFLLLATIQYRGGEPVEAFLAARRALELDAINLNALMLVANVGMQIGQIDEANEAAQKILTLEPNSLVGLQVQGLYQLYRDKTEDAEATARKILSLNPTDEAGTIISARIMAKKRDLEGALAFIRTAMQQSTATPSLVITEINLARALRRPEEMLAAFERLATMVPDRSASLRLDEINLLYKLGHVDRARARTAEMLARRSTGARDLALLQRIWFEFDRTPFTRESVKAAKDWSDPIAMLSIGRYLLWQGQPQLADDLFFSFPESLRPIGFAMHLRAALLLGYEDLARTTGQQVLESDTDNVDALLLRSTFEERAGKIDFAIEAAQRALNSDQTDPEIYVILARLHAKAGAKWRASQMYEDGMRQLPQNFLLIEHYTQFLHELGNKSRAVSVSRTFARSLPSSVLAWTIMARQCDWAGDAACAAEAAKGKADAATRYQVDDSPGAAPDRGLLGRF